MTPADLARLHALAFVVPRPWSAAEFADLTARADTFLVGAGEGFLLGRVIADEAELLTLAVAPAARRRGLGAALVGAFLEQAAARGAATAFLEVAADNAAAIALYSAAGFARAGLRKGYFRHPDGRPIDALVMARALSGNPAPA